MAMRGRAAIAKAEKALLLPWMAIFVAAVACQSVAGPPSTPTSQAATPTPTTTPTTVSNVCLPNPDPVTPNVLVIETPRPGDEVRSPFPVTGRIAAFEATFRIELFDSKGRTISEMAGISLGGQTLSRFAERVTFPQTAVGPACLWVFERSARDGSPIHVGQVPLILLPSRQ